MLKINRDATHGVAININANTAPCGRGIRIEGISRTDQGLVQGAMVIDFSKSTTILCDTLEECRSCLHRDRSK